MKKLLIALLPLTLLLASCGNTAQPEKKPIGDTRFLKAYACFYGAHYADRGIAQNVFDLDLYSAGIDLDSTHHIVGTGSNLYFSDIFVSPSDNTLQPATYLSDTTGTEFTFLPGVDYEGNISGAYILQITDGKLTSYTIFDEGTFTLLNDGDTAHINVSLKYRDQRLTKTYEAEYHGVIEYSKK